MTMFDVFEAAFQHIATAYYNKVWTNVVGDIFYMEDADIPDVKALIEWARANCNRVTVISATSYYFDDFMVIIAD